VVQSSGMRRGGWRIVTLQAGACIHCELGGPQSQTLNPGQARTMSSSSASMMSISFLESRVRFSSAFIALPRSSSSRAATASLTVCGHGHAVASAVTATAAVH
jgi:hypothetical protein